MTPTIATAAFRQGEFHAFDGGGQQFLYMVPSGGIFAVDDAARVVLDCVKRGAASHEDMLAAGAQRGIEREAMEEAIFELYGSHAIAPVDKPWVSPLQEAPAKFPLQTLVINVTNQCNLSCEYCYEFGEDKVATPEGKPKFMDWDTARQSVDYLFAESAGRRAVHITFFGGETLMNFGLIKQVVDYAREKAHGEGRYIDFSLTTNATLLTPTIIEYLSENQIGVTVSMDGPKELHDQLRVFANGKGSYDIIEPRVRELLKNHRTRPITARVTMTNRAMDVMKTYRHLHDELGFWEVGFAPVTTAPNRLYAINEPGMDRVLEQFRELADEYLEFALRGEHHGFSNVSDTLAELHQGVSKSHPCGAGLGLLGVGPSGDLAPCHRFVDSDVHSLGHISTGLDLAKQADFLNRGHINTKYDCHSCWARPVCAGGCHHEAFVRYGDTGHANLHYCDWIRGWTDTVLQIYGTIAAKNPKFLEHFTERKAA
ncbi:MAG: quinohemoprotein amine dehydrogenase maturation protein [Bryobacteraceae bacterium]